MNKKRPAKKGSDPLRSSARPSAKRLADGASRKKTMITNGRRGFGRSKRVRRQQVKLQKGEWWGAGLA